MTTTTTLAPPSGALRITDLDDAWKTAPSRGQLRALRAAGERLRERFARGPRTIAVRTLPLGVLPYSTADAFAGAGAGAFPLCSIALRAVLVQFFQGGEVKHLLFGATDIDRARNAPRFERARTGALGRKLVEHGVRRPASVETQLTELGLGASDIDYLAFSDFRLQDLRELLGASGASARFPRATLLAPRTEWEDWLDLPPLQRPWYVPGGRAGIPDARVQTTSTDLLLGDGVMLLRTPGRTSGHQTLFVHTDQGIWGVSANGVCADSWSPLESKNARLRAFAHGNDIEVVMNGSDNEHARSHYSSMILERTVADRVPRAPGFVQMFPASELTPTWFVPGIAPTVTHPALHSGTLARGPAR